MLINVSEDFIRKCIAVNYDIPVENVDLSQYSGDNILESIEWFFEDEENPRAGFNLTDHATVVCRDDNVIVATPSEEKVKRINLIHQLAPSDLAAFLDNITNCCNDLGRGEEDICNICFMHDGCGKSIDTIDYLEEDVDSADPKSIIEFPKEDQ